MKPLLLAITGTALAGWAGIDAAWRLAQEVVVGPNTQVSGLVVFQVGVLIASSVILIRLGMLLAEWKRAIDKAVTFATHIQSLEERLGRAELRLSAQEELTAQQRLIVQEHAARLGLRQTLDDIAGGTGS